MLARKKIKCEVTEENREIIEHALSRKFEIGYYSWLFNDGIVMFKLFDYWNSTYNAIIHLTNLPDSTGFYVKIEGDGREPNRLGNNLLYAFGILTFIAIYYRVIKKDERYLVMILLLSILFVIDLFIHFLYKYFVFKKVQKTLNQLPLELNKADKNEHICSSSSSSSSSKCGTKLEEIQSSVSSQDTSSSPTSPSKVPRKLYDVLSIIIFVCAVLFFWGPTDFWLWQVTHITPPLTYGLRDSAIEGKVLRIRNEGSKPLECIIHSISENGEIRSRNYYCTIKFGETKEVGMLEIGRYLYPGEKVIISAAGYLFDMVVSWEDERHMYCGRDYFGD